MSRSILAIGLALSLMQTVAHASDVSQWGKPSTDTTGVDTWNTGNLSTAPATTADTTTTTTTDPTAEIFGGAIKENTDSEYDPIVDAVVSLFSTTTTTTTPASTTYSTTGAGTGVISNCDRSVDNTTPYQMDPVTEY
ncbi:hypothetical protein [Geopseudomonas aromaticivorans]